jgi:hypothetical protein
MSENGLLVNERSYMCVKYNLTSVHRVRVGIAKCISSFKFKVASKWQQ